MEGSGPRVRLAERLLESLVRHMRVDLGRGQRRVTEHLLNAAEVGAALEQVGGHRVPESVRTEAGRIGDRVQGRVHDPPDDACIHPCPAGAPW